METIIVEGSRVGYREKRGEVKAFRSFTEDGERFCFATVVFEDETETGINVEELQIIQS